MKAFLGVSVLALALGIVGCSKVTAGTGTPGAAPPASSLPSAPSSTLPAPTVSSAPSPTPSPDLPSIGNPSTSARPSHHRPATPSKSPKPKPKPKPRPKKPADPIHVVGAYFTAINSHDYAKAWKLTNGTLGSSYKSFVAGFASTDHDVATLKTVSGNTVHVDLVAFQTDGTHKHFVGTFSVSHGLITAAHLKSAG